MLTARNHRKILLWLLLAPLLCLASCDIDIWGNGPQGTRSEVEYSEDWKYITLYLDGATAESVAEQAAAEEASSSIRFASAAQQTSAQQTTLVRVMTPDTARVGFDFFEAVFVSGNTIARVSWEHGSPASINKVRRGVTYSHNTTDRAILFAGRKVDKTLLALGELYSVDGVPGTRITSSSSFVTFELHALTGGASYDSELSSFLTAKDSVSLPAAETTTIYTAHIGTREFPLYRLTGGQPNMRVSYLFSLDGANWDDFSTNMIVFDPGYAFKREARYSVGNSNYRYAIYEEDTTTVITMTNNQTVTQAAQSPVTFSFDTSETLFNIPLNSANGIFTLVFEIPVHACTDAPGIEGDAAIEWAIRPAYGTYLYNMDNGIREVTATSIIGNWGGAILFGVNANPDDLTIPVHSGRAVNTP